MVHCTRRQSGAVSSSVARLELCPDAESSRLSAQGSVRSGRYLVIGDLVSPRLRGVRVNHEIDSVERGHYQWSSTLDSDLREWSVYVPIVVLTALIVFLSVVGGK